MSAARHSACRSRDWRQPRLRWKRKAQKERGNKVIARQGCRDAIWIFKTAPVLERFFILLGAFCADVGVLLLTTKTFTKAVFVRSRNCFIAREERSKKRAVYAGVRCDGKVLQGKCSKLSQPVRAL